MRKQLYLFLASLLVTANTFGQAPEKISYQAVLRDASNTLLTSTAVGMRISILQGSTTGSSVYTETQSATTNNNGLISIEIGAGTVTSGTFANIDWATGTYFIKTETDPAGGTTYTITGTSQLLSAPYALHAKKSDNGITSNQSAAIIANTAKVGIEAGTAAGQIQYYNGTEWAVIPLGQPGQFLQLTTSNVPSWAGAEFPTLTTAINEISTDNATCGGNITNDGGSTITARGVCWSKSTNPTIANSFTSDGVGTGNFSSSLTNLLGNTLYYVRAYATNSTGTIYGDELSFTTLIVDFPTLTTTAISGITLDGANSGGTISSDGGAEITARGICWSTSSNPTILDNFTSEGGELGSFSSGITGLNSYTIYYVRAYATNSEGTGYGNEINFTTLSVSRLLTFEFNGSDLPQNLYGNTWSENGAWNRIRSYNGSVYSGTYSWLVNLDYNQTVELSNSANFKAKSIWVLNQGMGSVSQITIKGYNANNDLIGTVTASISYGGYQQVNINLYNIRKITISSNATYDPDFMDDNSIFFDDFTYEQ